MSSRYNVFLWRQLPQSSQLYELQGTVDKTSDVGRRNAFRILSAFSFPKATEMAWKDSPSKRQESFRNVSLLHIDEESMIVKPFFYQKSTGIQFEAVAVSISQSDYAFLPAEIESQFQSGDLP